MIIRKKLIHFLYLLPFAFVFIGALFQPNDPDLGWHLKYGQYFFDHFSLLRDNTFSTDMSTYQWVNISWGTDLLTYAIFKLGGFLGLTLAASLVVTLTFYFFSKAWKLDFFEKVLIFPILLYVENSLLGVSFRGQLLSILFISILVLLFRRFEDGAKKSLFFIPPLFLVWANIHGQFIIGLGIFGLCVGSYIFQEFLANRNAQASFQRSKDLLLVLLASFLVTLINPFGIGLYSESARYIGNPLLFAVTEYLPPPHLALVWWNHILTGFFVLIGMIVFIFDRSWRKKIASYTLFITLYLMSFMVKRYSWSMYYFVIPFLKPIASFMKPDKKTQADILGGVIVSLSLIFIIIIKVPLSQYTNMSWDIFCRDYYGCSSKAAKVLEDMETGRLMNLYAWGGWLIWEHPNVKTSIDGRMHLWQDESGHSAYKDYYDYEQNVKDVDRSSYQTVYIAKHKQVYFRLESLAGQGKWKVVFEDKNSAIFTRVSN